MNVESSTEPPRRVFYGVAVILLSLAVATAFVQKHYEDGVATLKAVMVAAGLKETAAFKAEVENRIWNAECWQVVGAAAVLLALLSCGMAIWRRENHRWVWV